MTVKIMGRQEDLSRFLQILKQKFPIIVHTPPFPSDSGGFHLFVNLNPYIVNKEEEEEQHGLK